MSAKYEPHFHGPIQGVVIGDNNTVTLIFVNGDKTTVPFLAPPRPPHQLIGRNGLLINLKNQLLARGSVALSALNGLPGVGKTALAVELANDPEMLEYFQDGVLWARLGLQANVLSRLSAWGSALRLPEVETATLTSIEDWADAIHAAIGTRRMLLIADDAWDVESALAFKLGGPNCAHLITTRVPEVALRFAGSGSTLVKELNETDGLTLLEQLVPQIAEGEISQAREIVKAVGGLPLALILIGNYLRLQGHGGQTARMNAALGKLQKIEERLRLSEPQTPLERHPSLAQGAWRSLQAVIEISDKSLNEPESNILHSLSVFPAKPNTFSKEAALAVTAGNTEALEILIDHGLLEIGGLERYTLHQTISDYAQVTLADTRPYKLMVKFYSSYVRDHKADFNSLELESINVLEAFRVASAQGMYAALVGGVNEFYPFLITRGLYDLADQILGQAEQAAESSADIVGLTMTLLNRGKVAEKKGDYRLAEEFLLRGLKLAEDNGLSQQIIGFLHSLGVMAYRRGDYPDAEKYWLDVLPHARSSNQHDRVLTLLNNLGTMALDQGESTLAEKYISESFDFAQAYDLPITIDMYHIMGLITGNRGDFDQAKAHFQRALDIAKDIGHQEKISALLGNLGWIVGEQGDLKASEEILLEGLAIARGIKHPENTSFALMNLGWITGEQGKVIQAEDYLDESLSIARKIGHSWLISNVLNEWGEIQCRVGKLESARAAFQESMEIAIELRSKEFTAAALFGLAQISFTTGKLTEARRQAYESMNLYKSIGHYKEARVNRWLT